MINEEIQDILIDVQKPGRYIGQELNSIIKNPKNIKIRFAFCFPDIYEIGMSHLGLKILYGLLNDVPDIWCERVFMPWIDMYKKMEENHISLFALESGDEITNFDIISFTLQYELSFTNVLSMLKLAKIPVHSSRRKGLKQIVIAGGPCAYNPEPLAEFIDIFVLGEGEDVLLELMSVYKQAKQMHLSRDEFLFKACKIEGIYVPKFYDVTYNSDGTISSFLPNKRGVIPKIKKRIMKNLNISYYPDKFVVPLIDIVHNRAIAEIFRGCIRGCRFCQAGFVYRPTREKNIEIINNQSYELCQNTGYDEISLSSLSTSDYSHIEELLKKLNMWANNENINISLPSLRVDGFSKEITSKIKSVRRSGLTFAPEAGTQRLRNVINKNVTEEELMKTCKTAFNDGWNSVKLYFMIGLPTEDMSDVENIINMSSRILDEYKKYRGKSKLLKINISVSSFVPKPFTPFQWESQDTIEMIKNKQDLLKQISKKYKKNISLSWSNPNASFLEAIFARGDRNLCKVLYKACEQGVMFDSWTECFDFDKWMQIFEKCNVNPEFYANRTRNTDEILPWDHIDIGIKKDFFIEERKKSIQGITTKNCRESCSKCGASCFGGGVCFEKRTNSI